jgi:hypothetical protein
MNQVEATAAVSDGHLLLMAGHITYCCRPQHPLEEHQALARFRFYCFTNLVSQRDPRIEGVAKACVIKFARTVSPLISTDDCKVSMEHIAKLAKKSHQDCRNGEAEVLAELALASSPSAPPTGHYARRLQGILSRLRQARARRIIERAARLLLRRLVMHNVDPEKYPCPAILLDSTGECCVQSARE